MQRKREEIIAQSHKKGSMKKVPHHVLEAFFHVIKIEYKGETTYAERLFDSDIKEATRQQQEIGAHPMLRGFLAKEWKTAIEAMGVSHPEQRMNTLQQMIWDTIMDPLWQERNNIKHWKDNAYGVVDDKRLAAGIL